jgi:glycerophosphoryl diester phosphodiesterase
MHRALRRERPLVFAHRGGAKLGPENTIAAFARGLESGADGLELDVRLSRDGEVMVIHDDTVDRTTDGRGPVAQHTANELGRMNVLGSDDGVPRLAEVLARFPNAPMIVELKEGPELGRRAAEVVRRAGAFDRVVIGSYMRSALRAVRRSEPRVPTGSSHEECRLALFASRIGLAPRWAAYRAFQVPERTEATRIVSRQFVRLAHAAGLAVQVWVVDEPDDIMRLLDMGVDGIISDRPDLAVDTLRRWRQTKEPGGRA